MPSLSGMLQLESVLTAVATVTRQTCVCIPFDGEHADDNADDNDDEEEVVVAVAVAAAGSITAC